MVRVTGKKMENMTEDIAEVIGEFDDKTKQFLVELNKYILDNPRKSALIGIGFGLVLSMILSFIFRRKH